MRSVTLAELVSQSAWLYGQRIGIIIFADQIADNQEGGAGCVVSADQDCRDARLILIAIYLRLMRL